MNFRLLSKIFGSLVLLLAVAMAACGGFALFEEATTGESSGARALWLSTGMTALLGGALLAIGWKTKTDILRKEAIVVVGLGWVISGLVGMLPYTLCEPSLNFDEALFESVSGFTTTGSTVIQDLDRMPRSILLWRSISQWLGGAGILVLFVALLSYVGVGAKSLMRHESSLRQGEGSNTRVLQTARQLWVIYLVMTALCILGLLALGMNLYDAVNHGMCTVATGGFSPYNESIGYFRSTPIELFVMVMMLLCGTNFLVLSALYRRQWKRLRVEEESRLFYGMFFIAVLSIGLNLTAETGLYEDASSAFLDASFAVASIITSSGFTSNWRVAEVLPEGYEQWPGFSVAMLLVLMAMGGCAGSTAGGLKVSRFLLFLKMGAQEIIGAFRPRKTVVIKMNGMPAEDSARSAALIMGLFTVTLGIGTLVISLIEPHLDLQTCYSCAFATLFNIGPGLGEVGPTDNFAHLKAGTLLLLSLLMVLGRLELLAIFVLFVPSLWRKY
ncbi:MAG: TrkH family potassium uptake protein [Verrucomicrobiota bacterium]